MKLVIVESPAKTKTISKYLGKEYTVKASVGHVRDLPKNNKYAIDIEKGFKPHYIPLPGKEKVIKELAAGAAKADEVILATDPDREGEAIAWHVAEAIGIKNPKRIVFHEITEKAVKEALHHARSIDRNLLHAQEARRVLDRLFGYELSGLIWKKVRYGLSAGRVQSPALRILVEREREITAFKPEDFWVITAHVITESGAPLTLLCVEEPRTQAETDRIIAAGQKETWRVDHLEEKEMMRSPRPPFTTSTLQQAASSRLGFSPAKTMGVAQKLYEAGSITYMRTDSVALSSVALEEIAPLIEREYGKNYVRITHYKTKSKSAQEAHEAIRPTSIARALAGYTDEQKKLYTLIRTRAIASQMAPASLRKMKIVACVGADASIPTFTASGSRTLFPGWLKADTHAAGEDVELPKVATGETLTCKDIQNEQKETQPPPRYSEAGLVKELEKRGIGRPSTYASIIKTIIDRGYVVKENRSLRPTDIGEVVSSFLEKNFEHYVSDSFTAEMEDKLDRIALGENTYLDTLQNFYTPFHHDVVSKENIEKLTNLGPTEKKWKCPLCGAGMVIKLGRNGRFMSCEKYPECEGGRTIEGAIMEGPKETGKHCPKCEHGMLVERHGKYGKFISCSTYPKCKFIEQDPEEEKKKHTGVACPLCKKGDLVERRGRFGPFYSCSSYPACRYTIKSKPTGKKCQLCGALMMEGTKTIPDRCSDKTCPNHNPHKLKKEKKSET